MIFSILVIVLIGAVAYFHYTQGLFSATLSAICAIIAALMAFSYHETIIFMFLKGKIANYAHGLVLVAMFALIYIILRVLFDKLIPGNISLPLYADRAGAAVMGIIVGIFATGILTIAAHTLPFGPGTPYARYALQGAQDVTVPTGGRALDAWIYEQLEDAQPGQLPKETGGMMIPVDDIVVNMVDRVSGGALAGKQSLRAVHPPYAERKEKDRVGFLDEMFANRLGIQVGANRVAFNLPHTQQIGLDGIYALNQVSQADSEYPEVRKGAPSMKEIEATRKVPASDVLLVARVHFTGGSDDSDHNVRFSCASVRLMADGANYIPLGTLDSTGVLRVNLPDDFLIVGGEQKVDFVFQVPLTALDLKRGKPGEITGTIRPGSFLEVKRMGQVDLSGKSFTDYPGPLENTVVRKRNLPEPKAPPGGVAAGPVVADAPIVFEKADVSAKLFTPVNVGAPDEGSELTFTSGTATVRDQKFVKLTVNTTQTVQLLSQGDFKIDTFSEPPGMKMVQIVAKPTSGDPWLWADKLAQFELVDSTGAKHKPRGAWAKIKGAQGSDRMVARYESDADVSDIGREDGRPTDVYIAFLVPEGTKLTELTYEGKKVAAVNQEAK